MWWVIPEGQIGVIIGQATGQPALFTVTQSRGKPNGAVAGPYPTRLQAQAKANSLNGVARSVNPLNTQISNPLAGVAAIGDFFNRLTQPNTWLRVGEFVAGGLLIYLGLSAAMRGTEAQTAAQGVTRPAKKAVKVGSDLVPGVKGAKIARSAEKRVARERKVTEHAKKIRAAERAKKAS